MKKKELAILLSKLKTFDEPEPSFEQYQTDAEIAADALWFIDMHSGFSNKIIADLGSGTGILGIGALALGAKKVYFIEVDKAAVKVLKENLKLLSRILGKKFDFSIINKDIKFFYDKVDLVVQNPPFGVQESHMDRLFLLKALEVSPLIYSFHKLESENFLSKFSKDHGFKSRICMKFKFPLHRSMQFHTKKVHFVDVGFWQISLN